MQKTWFITGASRGFGGIWAEAALQRGNRVTATDRKQEDVVDLAERFGDAVLPFALDVTYSAQVHEVVHRAYAHFGGLDVLVNNAGASLCAATEEASDEQIRGLFDANYLGTVRVLRAALPLLRKQGCGHILGVSSGLGITALPLIGFYCATKWTVEALHESLAQEVRAFGLKVTLVEPGAYATDFGKSSQIADALEPYAEFRKQFLTHLADVERGDPEATAEAILKLVDAENPPLRFWARHFYSAQGPRSVCGAAGDVGSVGARVECGDGRAEEIDGSVDRATDPWNSGSETRTGSIPCSGEAGDRMEAGEVPIN